MTSCTAPWKHPALQTGLTIAFGRGQGYILGRRRVDNGNSRSEVCASPVNLHKAADASRGAAPCRDTRKATGLQVALPLHGAWPLHGSRGGAESQHLVGYPRRSDYPVVATSIFATLNSPPSLGWKVAAGLVSLLAAVVSALQTFFKFAERAEKQEAAGASYGALRRQIEIVELRYTDTQDADLEAALKRFRKLESGSVN